LSLTHGRSGSGTNGDESMRQSERLYRSIYREYPPEMLNELLPDRWLKANPQNVWQINQDIG
jgi:hypothetical protein